MTAQALLSANGPVSNVSSSVMRRNSTLEADGRCDQSGANRLGARSPSSAVEAQALSGLTAQGRGRNDWRLGDTAAVAGLSVNLPVNWRADGGIYIQSHAENRVAVKPGGLLPIPASIGVAVINTTSLVEISGNLQLISTKDLQAYSTASETLDATVSAGCIAG